MRIRSGISLDMWRFEKIEVWGLENSCLWCLKINLKRINYHFSIQEKFWGGMVRMGNWLLLMYLLEASADGILKWCWQEGQTPSKFATPVPTDRFDVDPWKQSKATAVPKVTTGSHCKPSTTPKLNGKPNQEQGEDKQFFQLFTGSRNTIPLLRF